MTTLNRDIVNNVLDALKNDPALAGYVKSFTIGEPDTPKKLFPYITIANLGYSLMERDTANDLYTYTMEIIAGTRSLARGLAFEGEGDARKGILQLCEDIVGVVRANNFNKLFTRPVNDISYRASDKPDSGGSLWQGIVIFNGDRVTRRDRF